MYRTFSSAGGTIVCENITHITHAIILGLFIKVDLTSLLSSVQLKRHNNVYTRTHTRTHMLDNVQRPLISQFPLLIYVHLVKKNKHFSLLT